MISFSSHQNHTCKACQPSGKEQNLSANCCHEDFIGGKSIVGTFLCTTERQRESRESWRQNGEWMKKVCKEACRRLLFLLLGEEMPARMCRWSARAPLPWWCVESALPLLDPARGTFAYANSAHLCRERGNKLDLAISRWGRPLSLCEVQKRFMGIAVYEWSNTGRWPLTCE